MKTEKVTAEERVAHTPQQIAIHIEQVKAAFIRLMQLNAHQLSPSAHEQEVLLELYGDMAGFKPAVDAPLSVSDQPSSGCDCAWHQCAGLKGGCGCKCHTKSAAHEALVDALRAQIKLGRDPYHFEYGCPVCQLMWHLDATDKHAEYPCTFGIAVKAIGGARAALSLATEGK